MMYMISIYYYIKNGLFQITYHWWLVAWYVAEAK